MRLLAVILLAAAWAPTAAAAWTLTIGSKLGLQGVSSEAVASGGVTRLYWSGLGGGIRFATSSDGVAFRTQPSIQIPGSDPSIVPLADGRQRMYFVTRAPASDEKSIGSAVSSDGVVWQQEPGTRLSIGSSRAGGVPSAVVVPGVGVRLYYIPAVVGPETIASATSKDGLAFTVDPGSRTIGGYVDPTVVQLADGSWLMVTSTSPRAQQTFHVFTSPDGLAWTRDPQTLLMLPGGANALDPTLLPLGGDRFRVYFTEAAAGLQLEGPYDLVTGVLERGAAVAKPTPAPAKTKHAKKLAKCKKGQHPTKKRPCRR